MMRILPDGRVERCMSCCEPVGHIMDPEFRTRMADGLMQDPWPCSRPICNHCDAQYVSRKLEDGRRLTGFIRRHFEAMGGRRLMICHDLTMRCQLHCAYCVRLGKLQADDTQAQELTSGQLAEVGGWLAKAFRPGIIQLMGGEPTLHPGWKAIASCLCQAGWDVWLYTNLVLAADILQFVGELPADAHSQFRVIGSLHAHRPAVCWPEILGLLAAIRSASSVVRIGLMMVDYAPDFERADPRRDFDTLRDLRIGFVVNSDIRRLHPAGRSGDQQCVIGNLPLINPRL